MTEPRAPGFTILLVDDNEVIQDVCGQLLAGEGYDVLVAEDGDKALALLAEHSVDLVLLDVMMPGPSGFEVLARLRRDRSPEELPVIMATAKDQKEDVLHAFELGANDYIVKPFDFPVLLARIQAQLRAHRARRRGGRPLPSDLAIEPDTVLDGKYRLETLIGHGNYGAVYRALQLSLQRPVAVKLLDREGKNAAGMVERFLNEGISACRVDHPNAVSVIDSSVTAGGVPYLVMELLEGHTLDVEVKRAGRLDPRRCAEILFQICDVLDEVHSLGIIHRDVKPQNVFLHQGRQGEIVKVLDFGIAKLVGDPLVDVHETPEEVLLGTPLYMAPERFTDQPYDGRSDVYSVGVMLYEMLAGELPFGSPARNPIRMLLKHMQEPPRPLFELCPDLPLPLVATVHRALAKDPAARPTARQLASSYAASLGLPPPAFLADRGEGNEG